MNQTFNTHGMQMSPQKPLRAVFHVTVLHQLQRKFIYLFFRYPRCFYVCINTIDIFYCLRLPVHFSNVNFDWLVLREGERLWFYLANDSESLWFMRRISITERYFTLTGTHWAEWFSRIENDYLISDSTGIYEYLKRVTKKILYYLHEWWLNLLPCREWHAIT